MKKQFTIVAISASLLAFSMIPVFFRMPNPLQRPILYELHDASHTALFFIITLFLFALSRHFMHTKINRSQFIVTTFIVMATSLMIGGAIEIVQFFIGREASWGDMGRNSLGIIAAACFYNITAGNSGKAMKFSYASLALLAVLIAIAPALPWLQAQYLRDKTFPVLMDFESAKINAYLKATDEAKISIVSAPRAWTENTSMVVKIDMPAHKHWPGFVLRSPQPDWSQFNRLNFDVFSLEASSTRIALVLFTTKNYLKPTIYRTYTITPGLNHLFLTLEDLPVGDLSRKGKQYPITKVIWHTIKNNVEQTLFFDNITLSQK